MSKNERGSPYVFDRHLLCHDWEPVDGGAPVLHECEEIVEEAFSGGIHVELVQLPSRGYKDKQCLIHIHLQCTLCIFFFGT